MAAPIRISRWGPLARTKSGERVRGVQRGECGLPSGYPRLEAGAIAAMVAAGETGIDEIWVVARFLGDGGSLRRLPAETRRVLFPGNPGRTCRSGG